MSIDGDITKARHWLTYYASDLRMEVPMRLHENIGGGLGFAPPFHPEFERYIGELECRVESCSRCKKRRAQRAEDRQIGRQRWHQNMPLRTKKAFRRLRQVAPAEFDVLWLAVSYGMTIEQIVARMNDWNYRNGRSDVYSAQDIVVLALLGLDKLEQIW